MLAIENLLAVAFVENIVIASTGLISLSFCESFTRLFRIITFDERMASGRPIPNHAFSPSFDRNPYANVNPRKNEKRYKKNSQKQHEVNRVKFGVSICIGHRTIKSTVFSVTELSSVDSKQPKRGYSDQESKQASPSTHQFTSEGRFR